MNELEATLEKDPAELGHEFAIWTVEHLREHLAKVASVHGQNHIELASAPAGMLDEAR